MHFVESPRVPTLSLGSLTWSLLASLAPVMSSASRSLPASPATERSFASMSPAASSFAVLFFVALSGVFPPGAAMAQSELTLVRDMLRLDAERALEAERNRAGRPAPRAASAPVRQPDRIAVAAIYGVAGALRADVLVNGTRLHFLQGQKQARNATQAPGEFQLAKIDDLCVHLSRAGERAPRVVCYAAHPGVGPAMVPPGSMVSTPVGTAFASGVSLPLGAPFPVSSTPSTPSR